MLLSYADAGVAKEDRDLVDGNAGQQHLNGEGVAEHVAVGALWGAVGIAQVGDLEEPTIGTLPIGHKGLGKAVASPEEVAWVGFEARWNRAEQFRDLRRQRHKDGDSGFGLVKQQFVLFQARAFERDSVSDSQAAPSHQLGESTDADPSLLRSP